MKILILGAGGTGGYFGGRLHQGGADVTFLVREARAQHIATHGLMLESPKDKVTLHVKTVLAGQVSPEYDVVILSCKAYDLASGIVAITPAMGERTCVLPLLNGMAHIAALDAAFGQQRVMGGACQISATLTKDGVVKSMMESHALVWGARDPAQVGLAQELGKPFANTVLDWRVSDTIMLDMWEKLTFLSTLAGMTCLMRAGVGDILAAPGGAQAITRYLDACIAIATKEGYAPRGAAIERFRTMLSTPGSTLTASMLRDLENGGPIEADHIVGFMLEKARVHGVDEGMLAVAFAQLKAYEGRRSLEMKSN
jgi:2-dehydropantoate 2-reductase